jgi:hypothetical protein|tara:strand:- start:10206 stop:10346 length:141 start_codon:yes stop_codon:yes gene_type:complete
MAIVVYKKTKGTRFEQILIPFANHIPSAGIIRFEVFTGIFSAVFKT